MQRGLRNDRKHERIVFGQKVSNLHKGGMIATMKDWTLDEIQSIIQIFEESDLSKIEIIDGEKKIVLKRECSQTSSGNLMGNSFLKNTTGRTIPSSFQSIAMIKEMQDELAEAKESIAKENLKTIPAKKASTITGNKEGIFIKATSAGIFYLQSKPGELPYVEVGKHVKKGETVALIEAMKMITEIPAPCDGVIKEILFKNEQFVEYDSPIMLILEE